MSEEKKPLGTTPVPQEPQESAVNAAPVVAAGVPAAVAAAPQEKVDLSKESYDKAYKVEAWNSTPAGRLAIRTFSRGVMGAMFFTAGGLLARRFMFGNRVNGQDVSTHAWESYYKPTKSFGKIIEERNPFQFVAKTIDTIIGKPIEWSVTQLGGDGVRAVHFRPTQYRYTHPERGKEYYGRSLGFETMMVTFDFFCASIGDALGRDLVGCVDPAVKKSWMDDKGHIKWPEAVKSMTDSTFRYVTYNGGEDWAVALPYVYFMKAQRNWLDKKSPGFGIDFDASLNGGGIKVRQFGSDPHYNVAGSFNLEGIFDLQTRFTVYNMGTLLYRELYDKVDKAWHGQNINLYGDPLAKPDPNKSLLDKTADVGKWIVRGIVKGAINMTPAVPFFWITRGMQSKHRGMFIDPKQNAAIGFRDKRGAGHYIYANDLTNPITLAEGYTAQSPVHFGHFDQLRNNGNGVVIEGPALSADIGNPSSRPGYRFDERRNNAMENGFSALGKASHEFSGALNPAANFLDDNLSNGLKRRIKGALGLRGKERFARFTRPYINAAVSYTPYMYMKAETARLWDYGKTDMALERTIDGAAKLNWKEFRTGLSETFDAILHRPLEDPAREAEAARRIVSDTSFADYMTKEEAEATHQKQLTENEVVTRHRKSVAAPAPQEPLAEAAGEHTKKHAATVQQASHIPWQERVVKGRDGIEAGQSVSTKHALQSHTDREEMRKLLEEVQPPTNSVH